MPSGILGRQIPTTASRSAAVSSNPGFARRAHCKKS
jgi:hypothetical protein